MITTMEIFNDTDGHSGFTIARARQEEVTDKQSFNFKIINTRSPAYSIRAMDCAIGFL
jgi:hypothetical protein